MRKNQGNESKRKKKARRLKGGVCWCKQVVWAWAVCCGVCVCVCVVAVAGRVQGECGVSRELPAALFTGRLGGLLRALSSPGGNKEAFCARARLFPACLGRKNIPTAEPPFMTAAVYAWR